MKQIQTKCSFDLFEMLRTITGSTSVSDLRKPANHKKAILALAKMDKDSCQMSVWNDALMYLLDANACRTPEEAHDRFVKEALRLERCTGT